MFKSLKHYTFNRNSKLEIQKYFWKK